MNGTCRHWSTKHNRQVKGAQGNKGLKVTGLVEQSKEESVLFFFVFQLV